MLGCSVFSASGRTDGAIRLCYKRNRSILHRSI
jgi:hypothetical protein